MGTRKTGAVLVEWDSTLNFTCASEEFPSLVADFLSSMSSGTRKCKFMLLNSIFLRYLKSHSELKEFDEIISNRKKDDKQDEKLSTECWL